MESKLNLHVWISGKNIMYNNTLKSLLVAVITLFIFYLLFTQIDGTSVIQILSNANLFYILASILTLALIIPIAVFRWQVILKVTGHPLSFWRCLNILMAALPLTSITPSKSGDVVKAYYLKNEIPMSITIGTVFTERVFDVLSLIIISIIGSIFYFKIEFLIILTPVLLVVTGLLVVISNSNLKIPLIKDSWNSKLQNMTYSMRSLTKNRKAFYVVLLLSFVSWILAVFQTALLFYALRINIPFLFTMANVSIAIFVGLIPVTLGGMGTRDAAIILLFSEYGQPNELLSIGILFSVIRYWIPSIVGIPFMLKKKRR